MLSRFVTLNLFRYIALLIVATGVVALGVLPGSGEQGSEAELKLTVNQTVEALWERADGPVRRQQADRAWLWGPEPITTSTEYYPESPSGTRSLVYYEKGRLDILDAGISPSDEWYCRRWIASTGDALRPCAVGRNPLH